MTRSFEETYPRYPFAGLVDLGLALAGLVVRARAKPAATPAAGGMTPATR